MSHPLSAVRPPSSDLPPGFRPAAEGENIFAWAKTVPAVQKGVLHRGKSIDVLNLRQRIAVASPSYGFQVFENYFQSYVACKEELQAHYRMPDGSIQLLPLIIGRLNVPNDSHIDRARNSLTNLWDRADDVDWLYWWDCDIEVPPFMLRRLFAQALEHGLEFLCGHYAMKDIRPTFVANVAPGVRPDPKTGLVELMDGGTGSMLWHRNVLARLRQHAEVKPYACAPNTPLPGAIFWAYFSSGCYGAEVPLDKLSDEQRATLTRADGRTFTGVQKWESEDWKVCRLWQQLGGKVYGDTQVKLRHFGGLQYPPEKPQLYDATLHLASHNDPDFPHAKFVEVVANWKPKTPPPTTPAGAAAPVIPIEESKAA